MSITDELREWAHGFTGPYKSNERQLLAIADRIDEQREKDAIGEYTRGYNAGFNAASAEVESADELRERIEREYVKLPVDADGVPIHIGDELRGYGRPNGGVFCKAVNERMVLVGEKDDGYKMWLLWDGSECRHYHAKPDSWERIIEDAVKLGYADYPTTCYEAELVKRCKRLAGE